MTPIRVVVVDDHIVFREGLRALLSRVPDIEIVGEAATTDDAVQVTTGTCPDVVLMDLNLPGAGGAAATTTILASVPAVAVLVLTMHSDDFHLREALAAGARGYILKDASPDSIVRGIRAVHQGQVIFDGGVATLVLAAPILQPQDHPFPTLTDREREILDRIARGMTNESIAARMGINVKTVQNNVSSILLKLGARDRAHAVAVARDAGVGRRPLG